MTDTVNWVHVGGLHMDAADGWLARDRLMAIVGEVNECIGDAADFVFLPGDNAADGEAIARTFADSRVAFVDTGHTHYNELLNDGRVIYGATRSTARIEEDGGRPGYAIVTVHARVPSWRFKPIGSGWPHVQIVAPADLRLVTWPADPRQVPRPGAVEIVAKVFGMTAGETAMVAVDGAPAQPMTPTGGLWRATVAVGLGLHEVSVSAGDDRDTIRLLIRDVETIPHRGMPVAPGHDIHAIGSWPEHGIEGTQLGPNKNGARP